MAEAAAFTPELLRRAGTLLERCRQRGWHLATAESCTGGLIAGCLTELAGSSDVVDRGYVTYSNGAKVELLGVRSETLARHGAVSEATAREMAEGALARAGCDLAIAVTGIAGPGGGSATKPVGLVHLAVATRSGTQHRRCQFDGDRTAVRLATVAAALEMAAVAASASAVA
ncbi:MAG: CinA family protein [Geminicoccaceae bacterium]